MTSSFFQMESVLTTSTSKEGTSYNYPVQQNRYYHMKALLNSFHLRHNSIAFESISVKAQ